MGRAVKAAYTDTGADGISCPYCAAEPGAPCTRIDGQILRVPHVTRIAAVDLFRGATMNGRISDRTKLAHPNQTPREAVDFGEPRRSKEAS